MRFRSATLNSIRNRPRFKLYTLYPPKEYEQILASHLKLRAHEFIYQLTSESAQIQVRTASAPFWKPCLTLRPEKHGEQTIIRGIFGPSSAVWTFFMFLYFVWSILWMVLITLWFVGIQIKSEQYSWALAASMIVLLLAGLTFFAAQIGKKKALREMALLRDFAVKTLLPLESTVAK